MGRAEVLFATLELQGAAYVDELIATRKSEEAFLDFKRSTDDGRGIRLDAKDRDNLAKCLSGFANSEGGVVLWGVDARGADGADTASGHRHLADAPRFAAQLDAVMSALTVPPVVGARSIPLVVGEGPAGFAATLIPQSHHAPHQTTQDRAFYIRAGSTFQPAMLSILAGLFGRAPRANVKPNIKPGELSFTASDQYSIFNLSFSIELENDSSVLASDFFATVGAHGFDNDKAFFTWRALTPGAMGRLTTSPYDCSMVSNADVRLPPRGRVALMLVELSLWTSTGQAPRGLNIGLTAGTSGAPPAEMRMVLDPALLEQAFDEWAALWKDPQRRAGVQWDERILRVLGLSGEL